MSLIPDLSLGFCQFGMCVRYPYAPFLIIFVAMILFIVMKKDFVKFKTRKEKDNYDRHKKSSRLVMFISRSLIFFFLLLALSSPYTSKQVVTPGNPSVLILADNSTSFNIFQENIALDLKNKLDKEIPTTLKTISTADKSAIGDAILNNMQGNDNVLIVSDGQNNYGRDLGDVVLFASTLNSTINALDISPVKKDVSVKIDGPSEVIAEAQSSYHVNINNIGDLPYDIEVTVDGNIMRLDSANMFTTAFYEGYHKIVAKLKVDDKQDYFPQNNIFYKAVKVVNKPNLLFVTKKEKPPLWRALYRIYEVDLQSEIPASLSKYSVVVLDDLHLNDINPRMDLLTDYVAEKGNGLIVVGGENSYDYGDYKDSLFETILPIKVGIGEGDEDSKVNVFVVIDISGSTGFDFKQGSSNLKIDVEKSLAINVVKDMRYDDNVGVIAFNTNAFVVSHLSPLSEKTNISDKIARLKDGGGTNIASGLDKAIYYLSASRGAKNIILVSDGITLFPADAYEKAEEAVSKGMKVYTVGVGANTNEGFMKSLAEKGQGIYFKPSETQKIRLLFGDTGKQDKDVTNLIVINSNHFITADQKLMAEISGFNFVVPKSAASNLITTSDNRPILTVWRFGLGRVVSLTTDSGSKWSGNMLEKENSGVITRAVNWAIGDPSRTKEFDVIMEDTTIDEPAKINVISQGFPESGNLEFSKLRENLYASTFTPKETGFVDVLGAVFAINYPAEFGEIGMNPSLRDIIAISNGELYDPNDIDHIAQTIKANSKRIKFKSIDYRWPFTLAALILFLIEIGIRRVIENKQRRD